MFAVAFIFTCYEAWPEDYEHLNQWSPALLFPESHQMVTEFFSSADVDPKRGLRPDQKWIGFP